MIVRVLLRLSLIIGIITPLSAQEIPELDPVNPRLQTVSWKDGQTVDLVTMPRTALTVVFALGEQVENIILGDTSAFDVAVAAGGDSLLITPLRDDATSMMSVVTDARNYTFDLRTGTGLTAAYLVRFNYGMPVQAQSQIPPKVPTVSNSTWRQRGDREIHAETIRDDGVRTYLTWAPDAAIPAIFSLGATGKEQVVNGHMRDDIFVIDRVHDRLIFRIDKAKADVRRIVSKERK